MFDLNFGRVFKYQSFNRILIGYESGLLFFLKKLYNF